jgi:hypothetical protein
VFHHLNTGVGLGADDRPRPWLHRVEGYHHTNLTPVQVVDPAQSATVDRSVPIIAKTDECIVYHSWEPRAMLASGTHSLIIGEVEVGVVIHLHLKCRHKNVTNPMPIAQYANTKICIKANSSKYKVKTELLIKDFVLELNTKNLGNSTSFLTITHMTISPKRFISYGILTINVAAEFCFWAEQRQNGSSISSLGLAKTREFPNAVLDENSLIFQMVQ